MNELPANKSLRSIINQNGVKPGSRKLAQFRQALALRRCPALYSQDGKGDNATAFVKLFDPTGAATWFITECSPDMTTVFGSATLFGDGYELGYSDLIELSEVKGRLGIGIEIDVDFLPKPLKEAISE